MKTIAFPVGHGENSRMIEETTCWGGGVEIPDDQMKALKKRIPDVDTDSINGTERKFKIL
tara:strand:+ start:725 stop:904 length:180 start_codon:yes stop_codon:yes gene_type:complete